MKTETGGRRTGPAQLIFLASMVALDFAFGMVAKPLMHASGLGTFVKVEMVVPAMLWALSRLTLDRFGTSLAYQLAWGLLATVLMPLAVLPGPLKLVPLLIQGLFFDAIYSGFRRWEGGRVYLAAGVSAVIGSACQAGMQLYMGLPWAKATQALLGFRTLTSLAVHLAGAALALAVWRRVRGLQGLRLLRVGPGGEAR
ncbi:MAG TPA: hypothetical protein PKM35_09715 [Holophaga sp.]|nr:hypothetical protein [Holophaga sp.]HPS68482.1 hypothetical protein [Holophaga sp.]